MDKSGQNFILLLCCDNKSTEGQLSRFVLFALIDGKSFSLQLPSSHKKKEKKRKKLTILHARARPVL
jgi:hypothetical protein